MYKTGTYRPTSEKYPVMDALAMAVAVDHGQGFVKAGNGSYDPDTQTHTRDNRTVVLTSLRYASGKLTEKDETGKSIHDEHVIYTPSEDDWMSAKEIFNYFDQILIMEKMADTLVKQTANHGLNTYNLDLSRIFDSGMVDVNKDLAMIVSLPNSRRIASRREEMEKFYLEHQNRGYIGEIRQRLKISCHVMDVKYLPRHKIHLVTMVTDEGKVGKFFMGEKLANVAVDLAGKDFEFVGTVKKQEINPHTGCQETVFNRVKVV